MPTLTNEQAKIQEITRNIQRLNYQILKVAGKLLIASPNESNIMVASEISIG